MALFNRKKKEPIFAGSPTPSRIEVEINKNASKEAANKAKSASRHLNSLLVENGFTLKIYLAAHNPAGLKNKGGK